MEVSFHQDVLANDFRPRHIIGTYTITVGTVIRLLQLQHAADGLGANMPAISNHRRYMELVAEQGRFPIRPERLEEISQLTQDNVAALRNDFCPAGVEAVPADFVAVLCRCAHE
jgi:hypothetical protein